MTSKTDLGTVRDCLGRERAIEKRWPDGSYNCPFCGYATRGEAGCPNPACFARVDPPFPVEMAREMLAKVEERERELVERIERHKRALARIESDKAAMFDRCRQISTEAESRGACVHCALESARFGRTPKYTKHRNGCPRERES